MSPTVLLVHGGFADGSSWTGVLSKLIEAGVTARAIANPLRGLSHDGDYLASIVAQTEGDVVLVGHSYGGAVITHAGSTAQNVKAVVYVGAFGLDTGESAQQSGAAYPLPALIGALHASGIPGSEVPDLSINVSDYQRVFAADVSDTVVAIGAITQRPISAGALGEPLSVEPAWKRLPSWWVLGTADQAIDPDYQRATAAKFGATVTELEGGSHSIAVSRPDDVAAVILDAVKSVSN